MKLRPREAVLVGVLLLLAVVLLTGAREQRGRLELRNAQVHGCERDRRDRATEARVQRHEARLALAAGERAAAERHAAWAEGFEERASIDCEREYPRPGVLP